MPYWIIWFAICIVFIGVFSFSVLPAACRGARTAMSRNCPLKGKILPILRGALAVSVDISVAVWGVTAFISRMKRGFAVGYAADSLKIILVPAISVVATTVLLLAAGLVWSFYRGKDGNIVSAALPEKKNGRRAYSVLLFAMAALAIASATPILTVMLYYLAVAKFALSRAKKVLLLLAAGVVVIAAVICFFTRRKIKKYLGIIFGALSAVLFLILINYSVLLVSVDRLLLGDILMWSAAATAIIIPLGVGSGILCGLALKTRRSKADADVNFN